MKNSVHVQYLIANEQDLSWGLTINNVGYQEVKVDEIYPPQKHPTRYLFSTERGRVLSEYQLVYTVRGKGAFTSSSQKKIGLEGGKMFLLFPGEWHTYKPELSVGWDEYWIGFEGANMDHRVECGFFNKQKPIFNVGIREDIVQLYKEAITAGREQKTGFQQLLAGIVNHLLGLAYSLDKYSSFEDLKITNQINQAKILMFEHFQTSIRSEEIAERVGMSYSWFRRIFKQYTGLSPHQYIQQLRIQKCKELLTNTMLTSKEIAFEVGFESPDYFCTVFKKHTESSPIEYREFTQGKHFK